MTRTEKARADLVAAIAKGKNAPDVAWRIAALNRVSYAALCAAYDRVHK